MIYKGVTVTFTGFTAEVVDVQLPKYASATQDTSHQGTVKWRTFVGTGLVDPGEVSLKINYVPASSSEQGTTIIGTTDDLAITFPTVPAVTVTYTDAICTGFEPENGTLGNFAQATVKFKISGEPSFA